MFLSKLPHNKLKKIIFWNLLLFASFNSLYGLSENNRFEHLTVKDGLSNSTVYSILQDADGFLWFGTPNGLNKYDGKKFTVFKNIPADSTSLTSNNAGNIYKDKEGIIWIGQWGGGLDAFDPLTNTVKHFQHDPGKPNTISDNRVQSLFEDSQGNLWVGTFSGGLNRIDRQRKKITIYKNDPENENSISNNRIWAISEDAEGTIWIATSNGLNSFYPQTSSFRRFYHDHDNVNSINNNAVRVLQISNDSSLWVGTIEGFNRVNLNTLNITRYFYKKPSGYLFNENSINAVLEDNDKMLWFCTANGIILFDPVTEKSQRITHIINDPESLSDNEIRSIYQDHSGIIWIGTKNKGLNKYNPGLKKFKNLTAEKNMRFRLKGEEVQSLAGLEYNGQPLLLFSNVFGFFIYNISTSELKLFSSKTIEPRNKRTVFIKTISPSLKSNKIVWIGAQQKFYKYSLDKNTFRVYKIPKTGKGGIRYSSISSFYEDEDNLWFGNEQGGLTKYDLKDEKVILQFIHSGSDTNSISHNEVFFLYPDGKKGFWVGTGNGLDYFDKEKLSFRHIKFRKNSKHDRRFFSMHINNEDTFWLGTEDGLIKYNPKTGNHHIYSMNNGLPDNKISSILEDGNGILWLGTEKGMSRFDPRKGVFINFDHSDGLLNSEYTPRAVFQDRNGIYYFGGKQGLDYFNPQDIQISNYEPSIAITDFQLLNKSITPKPNSILEKNINNIKHITIPYSSYVFSFEFAALDYTKSNKIEYAYKLEGVDKDWLFTSSARNFATYTNIAGGDYTFKVRATNGDGVWKSEIKEIKLTIVPPVWDTFEFKSLSVLFLALLIFLLFRLRVRAIKMRNKNLQEMNNRLNTQIKHRKKAEKEKEFIQEQLVQTQKLEAVGILAGGIAHDFNNLLTTILGNIELSQMYIGTKNKASKLLSSAQKAVMRSKGLTQQLLTFSKGGEPIRATASLEEVVRESANFVLTGTNVKSHFTSADNLWMADIDRGQISQVVQNLVINAKEALAGGGTITIEMSNVANGSVMNLPLENKKYVLLTIKDTGEGIEDEDLKNIFNPYFTTKKKGNGLGLAVSYSVVSKHNGHIKVESSPGKGTTFYVFLPAAMENLTPKDETELYLYSGQGRILVMDDDDSIRNVLQVMLTKLGYQVEEAINGDEAVSLYKKAFGGDSAFDLVIMDLTIPGGIGGKEAVKLLQEIDPNVTAIVSSGYSNDPVMANYEDFGFKGVILKPFTLNEIKKLLYRIVPVAK